MAEIHSIDYWIDFLNTTFLIGILALSWCSVFWIKNRKQQFFAYWFFCGLYANILRAYILPSYLEFAIGNLDTLPYLFAAGGRYVFGRDLWISLFLAIYVWLYPIGLLINRAIFYKRNKRLF